MPLFMAYDKNEYPLDGLSIWTLPKIAAWVLTLDYFFCAFVAFSKLSRSDARVVQTATIAHAMRCLRFGSSIGLIIRYVKQLRLALSQLMLIVGEQTKHPTPLLSILADDIQEGLEIFLIPFLSTLVVPLNWPEAWASMCLMLYVEFVTAFPVALLEADTRFFRRAMGHSGIR